MLYCFRSFPWLYLLLSTSSRSFHYDVVGGDRVMVGTLSGGVQNGRGGDRGRVAEIEGGLAQEASMEFPHYLIKKKF